METTTTKLTFEEKLNSLKLYNNQEETLVWNSLEIAKLQELIFNLYSYKGKIINKNKNVGKLGLEMDSQAKTNLEIIYSYFINLLIENWENQKYISIDIINKKYLTKDNLALGLDSITNMETYINQNNLNNSIIRETLEKYNLGNLLKDLLQNIETRETIINSYKVNCQLLKQNIEDKKAFNQAKKDLHKSYNNSLTKNTYTYTKLCNKIIDIINSFEDLKRLSKEITSQDIDSQEIINNNRIKRKLYKSKGLDIYNKATKYNNRKYKKQQAKIQQATKYNKNINSDLEKYWLVYNNNQWEIVEK